MLNLSNQLLDSIIREVVNLYPDIDQLKLKTKRANIVSMYRIYPKLMMNLYKMNIENI